MEINTLFQGQPTQNPQPVNANLNNIQAQPCSICAKPTDSNHVSCQKCKNMFHPECVQTRNPRTYICTQCSAAIHASDPPRSERSHYSNTSNSSRNSIVRKRDLELRRLEEERQLAIERDREFLNRKYQLLEQAEEQFDAAESPKSNSVEQWLEQQSCLAVNTDTVEAPQQQTLSEFPERLQATNTTPNNPNQSREQPERAQDPRISDPPSTNHQAIYRTPALDKSQTAFMDPTSFMSNNYQNNPSHIPFNSTHHNNRPNFIETMNSVPFLPQTTSNAFHPHTSNVFFPSLSAIPSSSMNTNLTHQQINARQTVPKDLPIFSGKPEEWPLFYSTYSWSTSVCGLTDAENLIRLQKSLCGQALQSVQHILIHPSCVSTAISTLQLLYGQPEKIIYSLKNRIRLMPTINPKRLETITSFAVQVKGLQSTIEACGITDELNNSSLLQELVSKLPPYFQINWGTYRRNLTKQNQKCNLTDFSAWVFDIGLSASSVHVESDAIPAAETFSRNKQRNGYVNTHVDHRQRDCLACQGSCNSIETCPKFKAANRAERWNIVREQKLCRQCLRKHYGVCSSSSVCGVDKCQFKHHPLLHKQQININKENCGNEENDNSSSDTSTHSCNTHRVYANENLFKIIPVTIYGNKELLLNTFAFIDEGSSTSLIDENVIDELNLSGTSEPLCLKWTGNVERKEEDSVRLCISVSGTNGKTFSVDVHTVKHLSLPRQTIDSNRLFKEYSHLRGLPIQGYANAQPRLLIGLNNIRLCTPKQIREGKANEPIAVSTRLGWIIYGASNGQNSFQTNYYHVCECNDSYDDSLSNLVKRFYSLETAGISTTPTTVSKDEEKAISILEKCTTQRPDGHYETSLLWKNEVTALPDSLQMAKRRYLCLEKKLNRDENLKEQFKNTMAEYLAKGYITNIGNLENVSTETQRVWYLPIFPVFNVNKPNKS